MSATTDHPATDPFTPSARQAFQELKRELQERLRRTLPDSSEILGVAQRLCAIRQSGAYLLDLCEPETLVVDGQRPRASQRQDRRAQDRAFHTWTRQSFGLGEEQSRKYLRVAQAFTLADVSGKALGIEALYQIASADLRLRPALWALAVDEALCAGALADGRHSGGRVLARSGDYDQAVQATVAAARLRAQRQDRAEAPPRAARTAQPLGALAQSLTRAQAQLEVLLAVEDLPGDGAAQARVGEQLRAVQARCALLLERLPGGEAAAAGQPTTDGTRGAASPPVDSHPAAPSAAPAATSADAIPGGPLSAAMTSAQDGLAAVVAQSDRVTPIVPWLLGLSPPHRELLLGVPVGLLLDLCPLETAIRALDHRVADWDDELAPPQPHYKRWRDGLVRLASRARTALCTLAAADPTQLLFLLPRLLDQLDEKGAPPTSLQPIEAELRALAARYGTAVVTLRQVSTAPKEEVDEEGDKDPAPERS